MPGEENPFKKALQGGAEPEEESIKPFSRGTPVESLTKRQQLRTVADLQLVDSELLQRVPKVRDLTVRDLNDLASEFSGIPTNNPRVSELTLDDLQDLEGVFFEFKLATGRNLAVRSDAARLTSVDVSCCCCTPCCCCAATDMSHTG